jgi:predicted RND superfamily exporter protein
MHSSVLESSRVSGSHQRGVLALLLVAATVALGSAAWPRVARLGQTASLVPPDDPAVELNRSITTEFGMANPVVWVIEARGGTVWTPALLGRVQALTREVFTVPGVIALDVVSLASPNLRDLRVSEDMLEPVYLMGEVPQDAAAIADLRRHVDSNPNYGGTLVSRDGRAAMVVANFVLTANPQVVASAALALRDRYSDTQATVFVTGAPVLAALAPRAGLPLAAGAVVILGAGFLVLLAAASLRAALAAALAALIAPLWTLATVAAANAAVLPWSTYAVPPTALLAAAVTTTAARGWRARLEIVVALGMGWIAFAVLAGAPAAAFGIAAAVGVAAAVAAGEAMRALVGCELYPLPYPARVRRGALVLLALALIGLPRLRTSFGEFGYAMRYLPEGLATDLRALDRDFPPPTALAIRFRGAPGFVESPEVVQSLDALADAVRSDPAVVRVLSLADLVKLVNRAFNENKEEFAVIPKERAMIARYLALAYSPGFARFIDRAFTQTALWVYLSTDSAADLARVRATLAAQLAQHPVADTQVDFIGGDGAVVLVAWRVARAVAVGAVALVLLSASGIGVLAGWRVGITTLIGGVAAAAFAAGVFGCLGVPFDLLSLPCLIGATAAAVALVALGDRGVLTPALAVMAVLACAGSLVGANLLGPVVAVLCGAPAVAGSLCGIRRAQAGTRQCRGTTAT